MRVVACATVALLCACGGGVDERLAPISLSGRLNVPSAAARAGVIDGTWTDADGEWFHVTTGDRTRVSVRKEIPFLSAGAIASLADVRRITLDVQKLDLGMAASIDAALLLDGVPLSNGVELPPAAVAPMLQVGLDASCPLDHVEDLPNGIELDVLVQPVVTR